MKQVSLTLVFIALLSCSFTIARKQDDDKQAITELIRNTLDWLETDKNNTIDLLPPLENGKDSLYREFDMTKVDENIVNLRLSGFFSEKFIANYKQIILTLNKGLKSGKLVWDKDYLPPFQFADDVDPWCNCQDAPYDSPSPWTSVETKVISLDAQKGKLYWVWGRLPKESDKSWKESRYKFDAEKEDGKWKITYMEGFDYENSVK